MTPPKQVFVHAALTLANAMFGLGSIIGAIGLPATNPLAFTTIREVISGVLLLILSIVSVTKPNPVQDTNNISDDNHHNYNPYIFPRSWQHFQKFCKLGFFLFVTQACYIVGLQLAGPVTASIWQPSAPSFTAALAMFWGLEPWSMRRLSGVAVAFGGCAAMVLLTNRENDSQHGGTTSFLLGNLLFFLNCSSTACFILFSKELMQLDYPSLTVIAWSYLLASIGMIAATLASEYLPANWVCTTTCNSGEHGAFYIPTAAFPALAYYILAMSVGSWGLIIWSNQFASGTLVMGYSVLQPVTSMCFTVSILILGWVAKCGSDDDDGTSWCLNEPGIGTLCGMFGVFCGLWLIIRTEPNPVQEHKQNYDLDNESTLTEYGAL